MDYSCKFRIYPNKEQENQILRTFGCCRFVFNHYLALRKEIYERDGTTMCYYDCSKDLTNLKQKDEMQWLKEVDATALQSALWNLENAYKHFFRRVKTGDVPGYPKFKSKHQHKQSYKSKNTGKNIKLSDNSIQLPKLGRVKCRVSKTIHDKILSATVSRSASGKYYVTLCCRSDLEFSKLPMTGNNIGVDVGLKSFAVSSNGVEYQNHKFFYQSSKRLARLQRQLSRKTKGSSNWNKCRVRIAKLHEHIANQRLDMLNKLSTDIVRKNDIICIEDLNIKSMMQNNNLSKHIADAGWGEFRRQLLYKSEWYGRKLILVDRLYPSSQTCSACGAKWSGAKDLKVRNWRCPDCGAFHNRDMNAAINILNEGMRIMA